MGRSGGWVGWVTGQNGYIYLQDDLAWPILSRNFTIHISNMIREINLFL